MPETSPRENIRLLKHESFLVWWGVKIFLDLSQYYEFGLDPKIELYQDLIRIRIYNTVKYYGMLVLVKHATVPYQYIKISCMDETYRYRNNI